MDAYVRGFSTIPTLHVAARALSLYKKAVDHRDTLKGAPKRQRKTANMKLNYSLQLTHARPQLYLSDALICGISTKPGSGYCTLLSLLAPGSLKLNAPKRGAREGAIRQQIRQHRQRGPREPRFPWSLYLNAAARAVPQKSGRLAGRLPSAGPMASAHSHVQHRGWF